MASRITVGHGSGQIDGTRTILALRNCSAKLSPLRYPEYARRLYRHWLRCRPDSTARSGRKAAEGFNRYSKSFMGTAWTDEQYCRQPRRGSWGLLRNIDKIGYYRNLRSDYSYFASPPRNRWRNGDKASYVGREFGDGPTEGDGHRYSLCYSLATGTIEARDTLTLKAFLTVSKQ